MKQSIMKKWVAALRSGEYRQTTGSLVVISGAEDRGFCCLGVLTDLCAKNFDLPLEAVLSIEQGGGICPDVEKWAGMVSAFGDLPKMASAEYSVRHKSLADLNDYGANFNQIADVIEENWKKL